MLRKIRDLGVFTTIEIACVLIFMLCALLLLLTSLTTQPSPIQTVEDTSIEAYAYAMPNTGWAPLTVYFSAFGSQDKDGEIVRYEWDLDANGSFESDTTVDGGYATYTYSKPGTYIITLQVTDNGDHTATATVEINVRHPASSSVDYWTVFDDTRIQRVDFILTQENWDLLWQDPGAKTEVEASAIVFGERVDHVAISMKGNSTLWFPGDKKPFKLDFNAYIEEQEYQNLKMLLFHNNFGDPSMLREKLAYDMMRFAGVPASHVAYVELWIDIENDAEPPTYWGVYTMVERPDRKFLANRFGRGNDDGNLYKADAWFEEGAADLAYYGEDINDYPTPRGEIAYALMYQDSGDYADIIQLCHTIDGVEYETPEDFATALEQVFNVDSFLRYLAVIFLNLNFDQYPYTGNNYYIYNNPGTGKFEWIAWDMNNSWGHFGGDAEFPLYGSEESLGPLAYAPLFSKVFEVERYRQTYKAYLDLLIRHWFNPEQIQAQAQALHALIEPVIRQGTGDKMYFGPTAQFSIEAFHSGLSQIVNLTRDRCEFIQQAIYIDE